MFKGSCLCGAVRFTVQGPLGAPDACHCSACRKWSGHYLASADIAKSALTVQDDSNALRWFASSAKVRRGFCGTCGSSLFWDPVQRDFIAVAMGALDSPSGTHLAKHIFTTEKGDYYDIADGLPQNLR